MPDRDRHHSMRWILWLAFLLISIVDMTMVFAEATPAPTFVTNFFQNHCFACHSASAAEGDLNLESLRVDFSDSSSAQAWIEVLDRINLGEMPPEDEPRPDEETLAKVTRWIADQIRSSREKMLSTGGRVVMRRMTRLEYARTVDDLFAVSFAADEGPLEQLPPDGAIKGFDRHSKALLIDPSLIDSYITVATRIARRAVQLRPPLVPQKSIRYSFKHTEDSAMSYLLDARSATIENGVMVVMEGGARTFGVLRHPYNGKEIPKTGRYRVRIRAGAAPGKSSEPIYVRIKQGDGNAIAQFRIDAKFNDMEVYEFEVDRNEALQGEFQVEMIGGTSFYNYVPSRGAMAKQASEAFAEGNRKESLRMKARLRAQGDFDVSSRNRINPETLNTAALPKLYLDYIEVTGPLQESFPPRSMQRLFGDRLDQAQRTIQDGDDSDKLELASSVLERLLPRAFRRPVNQRELDRYVQLVEEELGVGHDFEIALETAIVAVLCSPDFLFLSEPTQNTSDGKARPLSGEQLASRMSYFLWSSRPDRQLMEAAVAGKLNDPERLQRQVDRMLDDERVEGFIQGFARQWLKVDGFNRFPPDERIFPRFYETRFRGIEHDLIEQPLAMLRELIRQDGDLLNLLDSEWTMLNGRLAAFYGINGVFGEDFRRVSLGDRDAAIRGGLLGMAGLHRWGSDGSRTKPVERGKYLLDVLFNDPPPPPPPNAGEVEPNLRGEKLTVRERLRRHREQTTCNNCHRRIDPYGLALENFNTIGSWRELEDGEKPLAHWGKERPAIDPSGTLPTGDSFENFVEFKRAMIKQRERFLRGLTEKLLAYALARSVEPADRPLIDTIVRKSESSGNSLRTILHEIVASKPFQSK